MKLLVILKSDRYVSSLGLLVNTVLPTDWKFIKKNCEQLDYKRTEIKTLEKIDSTETDTVW